MEILCTISEILNIRESLIVEQGNPRDTKYTLIFNSCGISLVTLDQFLADGDGAACKWCKAWPLMASSLNL